MRFHFLPTLQNICFNVYVSELSTSIKFFTNVDLEEPDVVFNNPHFTFLLFDDVVDTMLFFLCDFWSLNHFSLIFGLVFGRVGEDRVSKYARPFLKKIFSVWSTCCVFLSALNDAALSGESCSEHDSALTCTVSCVHTVISASISETMHWFPLHNHTWPYSSATRGP